MQLYRNSFILNAIFLPKSDSLLSDIKQENNHYK